MSTTKSDTRYRSNPAVEAAPLQNESVLFNPETNRFCLLNRTMAFIWSNLEGSPTERELIDQVCNKYSGTSRETVESDVRAALESLVDLGLVAVEDQSVEQSAS
ncbi:MAG: PqqD family protein [Acidobacteria bacterium]|nr:PqqD family protein [Acidobacteriota bacterium]